jgi:hypothetical protein
MSGSTPWRAFVALTLAYSTPSWAAEPSAAALGPVRTQALQPNLQLDLPIAANLPLLLHFPVPCHTVYADPADLEARVEPAHPQDVVLLARARRRPDGLIRAQIACAAGVRVSLGLRLGPAAAATPRVEFFWGADAAPADGAPGNGLVQLMAQAPGPFADRPVEKSVRSKGWVLHADRLRRVGDLVLVDLRLQNHGPDPLVLCGLEVAAPTAEGLHWHPRAALGGRIHLQGPQGSALAPGATWSLLVGMVWPQGLGAFTLSLLGRSDPDAPATRPPLALPPLAI